METKEDDLPKQTYVPPKGAATATLNEMSQSKLRFLAAEMQSFDDFNVKRETWILEPQAKTDFLTLCQRDPAFVDQNTEWMWKPNAVTEDDLLCQANNAPSASKFKNQGTIGVKCVPGEILFATNRNKQLLYGQGCHTFYSSLTKQDGDPINVYSSQLIKRGIISIVNLQPNQLAIALHMQRPVVLLPGRHCYNNPDFVLHEEDIFTMKDMGPNIQRHTVVIIRVGDWEVGLGYDEGKPILMKPGLHVSRSPSFQFIRSLDTRRFQAGGEEKSHKEGRGEHKEREMESIAIHDNISIIRIAQTSLGCAYLSGDPVFLQPGLHVYNNPSFSFQRLSKLTDPYIKFDNCHIIQIQPDQIGLAWEGSTPYLLPAGLWHKQSPIFRFEGLKKVSEQKIEHGPITRFVVENGELGFAWQDGQVCEIPPGIGVTTNPNFRFVRSVKLSDEVIQFGNIAHVTTREGFKRPVFVDGKLFVLSAGYRKFVEPNLKVGQAFPIGEIIRPMHRLEVLTRDRTPMLVTGQVTYQIRDAKDLILNLGYDKLEPYIEQTLSAILRHAFSITDLSTISPDVEHQKGLQQNDSGDPSKPPLPMFKREAEDAEGQNFRSVLITEIHKELARNTKSWGITIHEVAISDVQFKDQQVADKLAAATSNTRTAEAEFDLTLAQNKIRLEKANVDAREKLLIQNNEAKIDKISVETKSALRLIEERTKAEAETIKLQASANAEALQIKTIAMAKRDAALLEAEGLKALAEAAIVQYSDPHVMQLKMMELWVQAAQHLSKAPTPTVVMTQGADSDGGTNIVDVFRKQGQYLLEAAMKVQEQNHANHAQDGKTPPAAPSAGGSAAVPASHSSAYSSSSSSAYSSSSSSATPASGPPSKPARSDIHR